MKNHPKLSLKIVLQKGKGKKYFEIFWKKKILLVKT